MKNTMQKPTWAELVEDAIKLMEGTPEQKAVGASNIRLMATTLDSAQKTINQLLAIHDPAFEMEENRILETNKIMKRGYHDV